MLWCCGRKVKFRKTNQPHPFAKIAKGWATRSGAKYQIPATGISNRDGQAGNQQRGNRSGRVTTGLVALDDEDSFVVDAVVLAGLAEPIVSFEGVVEQRIADFFRRLAVMFDHNGFKLTTFLFICAVINTVAV